MRRQFFPPCRPLLCACPCSSRAPPRAWPCARAQVAELEEHRAADEQRFAERAAAAGALKEALVAELWTLSKATKAAKVLERKLERAEGEAARLPKLERALEAAKRDLRAARILGGWVWWPLPLLPWACSPPPPLLPLFFFRCPFTFVVLKVRPSTFLLRPRPRSRRQTRPPLGIPG